MWTKTILTSVVLTAISGAFGQQAGDTTCAFNFSSGTGRAQTRYCVTANGNIAEFGISISPPIEFLNPPPSEGYGLCDSTNAFKLVSYYDYARTATTNWNPAVATLKDPTTLVVTRTTQDGNWKLTETVGQIAAAANAYGGAKIIMALTNLSTHNRFAILQRHVNVDAGSTFNDFDATNSTTTAMASGNWGLATTGGFELNLNDFGLAFNQSVPDGPDICVLNTNTVLGFFEGDGSSEQRFGLSIAAGQTKIATVVYKPI